MNSAKCPNCNYEFQFSGILDCNRRTRQKIWEDKPAICVWHYKKVCSNCHKEIRMRNGGQGKNNGKWFIFEK